MAPESAQTGRPADEGRWETLRHVARLVRDGRKLLPWTQMGPARLLDHWARRTPDNLALAYRDQRFSWRELDAEVNRYANWLAQEGIGAGDTVALVMDNRPDFVFAVMGLSRIGGVGSLINTHLRGRALAHALRVCRPRKLLVGGEHLEAVLEVTDQLEGLAPQKDLYVQLEAGEGSPRGYTLANDGLAAASPARPERLPVYHNRDVFCYIYTSGTTGLPKAAIIRNQRMLGANVIFGHLMHRAGPGDVIYVPLPLYHSSAMFLGWGAVLATGAAMALRRRFSTSEFWNDVRKFDATSFLYIGELCRYLLNAPPQPGERDHGLRTAVGNGLRPDIWVRFQERFGIPVIREFYGATEGNTPILNYAGRPGMIGRKQVGQAVVRCDPATGEVLRNARGFCETVEVGEAGLLVGRISSVLGFDGYVDREATQKKILSDVFKRGDRYFNTGDLIQLHEHGWLSFADRVGDTFRWKGENVSTHEVEQILDAAPGVRETNVYGVRVPGAEGRIGMAALLVSEDFDLERFAAFTREALTRYQRPAFLRLLPGKMRTTSTFKHQKGDYRSEGFDPQAVEDRLFVLRDDRYVPLDAELFKRIESGELSPG